MYASQSSSMDSSDLAKFIKEASALVPGTSSIAAFEVIGIYAN